MTISGWSLREKLLEQVDKFRLFIMYLLIQEMRRTRSPFFDEKGKKLEIQNSVKGYQIDVYES